MEKNLNDMFMMMIRNAYNGKKIDDLMAIKKTIELLPMYYIINNYITITDTENLMKLIDTNIEMIKDE